MTFLFEKLTRKKTKAKIALMGTSGSGKTYSGLLLARGLVGSEGKIAVVDTENGSAGLYDNLTNAQCCQLKDFSVDNYIALIKQVQKDGYDCLVIDSLSPVWDSMLDDLEKIKKTTSNSFTAWKTLTPKYNELIQTIVNADIHIICTMRAKTEYTLETNEKGRQVPKKVGLAPVMRDGIEYEFTIVFTIDADSHYASVSKDRTSIFASNPVPELLSVESGKKIADWLESGVVERTSVDYAKQICETLDRLSINEWENYKNSGFGGMWDKVKDTPEAVELVKNKFSEIKGN